MSHSHIDLKTQTKTLGFHPLRVEAPVVRLPEALVGHGPQLRVHDFADLLPVLLAASFPQDVVFGNEVVVFAFL